MKIFVTCALPYANGPLHLGHLRSTYIPADIYSRYQRMVGNDVLFVCATDEHGTPIAVKAEKEGKDPLEITTKYYKKIKSDLDKCDISFDNFSRTSSDIHYKVAQNFFLKLYKKGYIYEKEIKQFYCTNCKRFLPDRYVEGICPYCDSEGARGDHCEVCGRHLEVLELIKPRCILCSGEPEIRKSKHYFFKLSKFQKKLKEWVENNEELPSNVKNYTLEWLKEGLNDWIMTRDMKWGVPVPLEDAEGKVIYVWGEAFLGYISSAIEWSKKNKKDWKEYWDSGAIHFIGKDIIYHHTIFWPAMLMAYGCKLPRTVIAGEYLSLEGKKMSTSKNWVVWVSDFLKRFDSDLLRYYLTINAPLTRDTDFSWDDFQRRVNDELADILGNFIHRALMFTYRFFDAKIPEPSEFGEKDIEFEERIKESPKIVGNFIENFKFRDGLIEIMKLARDGNKYFNDQEPWKTFKENKYKAATCIYLCDQAVKAIGVLIKPYLPKTSSNILNMLNLDDNVRWEDANEFIEPNHKINKPKPLFSKIKSEVIEKEKTKLKEKVKNE